MPNTLAHIGINGLVTRNFIKKADFICVYFGAVIPDIPWMIQRVAIVLIPGINLYDLRLYCVILASLFSSLILSTTLAFLFCETKKVLIIFTLGSVIHLLLDSIEIKWANGVQLFAPFSWDLFNAGFFWPENIFIYVLTGFGFLYLIFHWKQTLSGSLKLIFNNNQKLVMMLSCLTIYFFLPILFLNNAEEADNHFVKTLRDYDHRTGKYFEIDRGNYVDNLKWDTFITPFNEELKVANVNLPVSAIMSLRAKFISPDEIQILDYHIHSNRDVYSYIGLLLVLILFIISLLNNNRYKKQSR